MSAPKIWTKTPHCFVYSKGWANDVRILSEPKCSDYLSNTHNLIEHHAAPVGSVADKIDSISKTEHTVFGEYK